MEPAFNLGKQIQSWPKYSPFLRHFAPHVSIFYSAGRIPIFKLLKINVKTLAGASITSGNDGNITGRLASVGAPGTWLDKYHISSHIMRSQLPNSIILRRPASSSQLLARCWSNTQYQVLTVFSLSPHLPSSTHPDPRHFISWQRGKMTIGDPISAKSLGKKYYQFISDFLKAAFEKICWQYLSLQVRCSAGSPVPSPPSGLYQT